MHIVFDKVIMFIRDYDGTKCLVLSGPENYDAIADKVRYFVGMKNDVTYFFSHSYKKIKIDSDDNLAIEKIMTMYHVVVLIDSVLD